MNQFLAILREFERYGGKGIVYGGCLRDSYCGIDGIKDVDIAIEDTMANRAAIDRYVEARRKSLDGVDGWFFSPVSVSSAPFYGNFPDVVESITVEEEDQLPVNFVVMAIGSPLTKETVAQRCDFGLCQIAMDTAGVYATEAFSRDFSRRTFTYLREPYDEAQFERSKRRFERFKERYTDWRMVVPALDAA